MGGGGGGGGEKGFLIIGGCRAPFASSSSPAIDSRAGQIFSPVDATKSAVR